MRRHLDPYVMSRIRRGAPGGGYRLPETGKIKFASESEDGKPVFSAVYSWCWYEPTQEGLGEFRILKCRREDCWSHKKYPHEQYLMVEEEGLRRLAAKVKIQLPEIRL